MVHSRFRARVQPRTSAVRDPEAVGDACPRQRPSLLPRVLFTVALLWLLAALTWKLQLFGVGAERPALPATVIAVRGAGATSKVSSLGGHRRIRSERR